MSRSRAVVLLSGGLDSATCLAVARADGCDCFALSFDYDQRHRSEIEAARKVAASAGVQEHRVMKIDLGQFGGSALTDRAIPVPESVSQGIPATYVPARNTVFLSLALAWAEVLDARRIYIGVNAVDYSGYPDCRPEYIDAFRRLAALATKAGVEGNPVDIVVPLQDLSKRQIIQLGSKLGVDYSITVSCYQADTAGRPCGRCESCRIRRAGFSAAGMTDPASPGS